MRTIYMVSSADFRRIKSVVMKGIRSSERPPSFVFEADYKVIAFVEFDTGFTPNFWKLTRSLALASGDEDVLVLAIEPDAESYFHKEFGTYGAIRLSINDSAKTYTEKLEEHPVGWPVDSLKFNSECLVWASDSGSWIAWGSRGFGFIAIAFKAGFSTSLVELSKEAGIDIMEKNRAVSDIIIPSFYDQNAAKTFAAKFIQNY